MASYKFLIGSCLLAGIAALGCEVAESRAGEATGLKSRSSVPSTVQAKENTAHKRRQEARKQLQDALEKRKAEKANRGSQAGASVSPAPQAVKMRVAQGESEAAIVSKDRKEATK